jgi:hypothetical protein
MKWCQYRPLDPMMRLKCHSLPRSSHGRVVAVAHGLWLAGLPLWLSAHAGTFTDDFAAGISPSAWQVISNSPLYSVQAEPGAVRFSKPAGGTTSLQYVGLGLRSWLRGDFDVSVDFADAIITRHDGAPGNQIQLNVSFGGQDFLAVRSDEVGHPQNTHVWLWPQASFLGSRDWTSTSGRLRITRTGAHVQGYVDNTLLYEGNFNTGEASVTLTLQNNGTRDATAVTFSDFTASAEAFIPAPDYTLNWWTADGGGSTLVNNRYALSDTIGQADAGGPSTTGRYTLSDGFWALDATIASTYTQTWSTNTLPPGLVAWWPAESNAADASGHHHDGTASGGVSYVSGWFGSGMAFNGTNSVVTVPDALDLRLTDALTIEFWAKRQRTGIDIVLEKGGDWNSANGGEANYGIGLHSANSRMFYFFYRGGWRGTPGVADSDWHHYAVVATNGTANPAFYIDGVARPVQSSSGGTPLNLFPSTRPLHLGAQLSPGWDYYGANLLDDVRLYNRALSPNEIVYLYSRRPWLNVTRINSQVILSWLAPDEGWALTRTNNLPSAAVPWPPVPPPYQSNGSSLQVIEGTPAGNGFYRLQKP